MGATTHYNLPTMATGAVDWPAIINDIVAKVEVGRTIKATAGETLAKGKAFYIKATDSKAYLATYTTGVTGLWQSSSTSAGVEGFGQIGGIMTDAAWTWTPGAYLYIDGSSVLIETDPTGVEPVAYALSATEIIVFGNANPDETQEFNQGLQISTVTTKPAADATSVGMMWLTPGGGGVADVLEVVLKSAADTYSWVNIATG